MLKLMDKKILSILCSNSLSKLAYDTLYYISRLAGLEVSQQEETTALACPVMTLP